MYIVDYAGFKLLLITRSGDVELNPGPSDNGDYHALSLIHLNIRSIRNKMEYIKDNISDYDILCFSESHLTNTVADSSITLDDMNLFRKDFTDHSSGLVTYISNKFISSRKSELEIPSLHALWTHVKFYNASFLLCNIYRQPNAPVSFWTDLNIIIEKALETNEYIIIVGDTTMKTS